MRRGEELLMRAIITVIGRDTVGIISGVSGVLSEHGVNIMDITQSILQEMFVMVMMIDISGSGLPFAEISKLVEDKGREMGVKIHVMHEDIFTSMHRI